MNEIEFALQSSLAVAREKRDALMTQLEDAQSVVRGLEGALQQHRGEPLTSTTRGAVPIARTDIVLGVLKLQRPSRLQTKEILALLHEQGHPDIEMDELNGTLAALRRQNRIWSPGRLQGWCLYEDRQQSNIAEFPSRPGTVGTAWKGGNRS